MILSSKVVNNSFMWWFKVYWQLTIGEDTPETSHVFMNLFYWINMMKFKTVVLCLKRNILYKLLFMSQNNIICEWIQKIFLYSLSYRQVKSTRKFLDAFPNSSFACFLFEMTLSPRVWCSRVLTSPLAYSLKRPIHYWRRMFTILGMIFKSYLKSVSS